MITTTSEPNQNRYARVIAASKKARWDIDSDVIRGRTFGKSEKFLPDGLTLTAELDFLSDAEKVLLSRVQGRTYANVFGLIERYIVAQVLDICGEHFFGDQTALEALVRFTDEELKHQELFRRIETLAAESMPPGYAFVPDANDVARVVLAKSRWSVLALTCLIELFTQVHYKQSIEPDERLSPLYKDVFRFHWMEESQHAVLDELEWVAEDARLEPADRDAAVSGLIELVAAVDGILRVQSESDASYFLAHAGRSFSAKEAATTRAHLLRAYRHQYIFSGLEGTRFIEMLRRLITDAQFARIERALSTLQ